MATLTTDSKIEPNSDQLERQSFRLSLKPLPNPHIENNIYSKMHVMFSGVLKTRCARAVYFTTDQSRGRTTCDWDRHLSQSFLQLLLCIRLFDVRFMDHFMGFLTKKDQNKRSFSDEKMEKKAETWRRQTASTDLGTPKLIIGGKNNNNRRMTTMINKE